MSGEVLGERLPHASIPLDEDLATRLAVGGVGEQLLHPLGLLCLRRLAGGGGWSRATNAKPSWKSSCHPVLLNNARSPVTGENTHSPPQVASMTSSMCSFYQASAPNSSLAATMMLPCSIVWSAR